MVFIGPGAVGQFFRNGLLCVALAAACEADRPDFGGPPSPSPSGDAGGGGQGGRPERPAAVDRPDADPTSAEPLPPAQAALWVALSAGQGATCPSARSFQLPDGARETIVGPSGQGDRIVDGGEHVVQCRVIPSPDIDGTFDLDLRLASGEIGNFHASGTGSDAGGTLQVDFSTTQLSLSQEGCTISVDTVLLGAVWIRSLSCPSLHDSSSPGVSCVGNGGLIFENCSN